MPTGYTADVVDGKITTLRDFALRCARGMGATIMMRDEPWDAPIPETFEPHTGYNQERLDAANALLAELEALTPEECEARARADFSERVAAHEKYEAERQAENDRVSAMLDKVRHWTTEAEGIREFMIEQLQISLTSYFSPAPVALSGEEWLKATRLQALRDISYHEKGIADEIHRTAMRNQWLADLRRSLEVADA